MEKYIRNMDLGSGRSHRDLEDEEQKAFFEDNLMRLNSE
jgi:hypothetical protein